MTSGTTGKDAPAAASLPPIQPPVYHPVAAYPVLEGVLVGWEAIRDEVIPALAGAPLASIGDDRVEPDMWRILPLLPEPEDRSVFPDWEQSRHRVPRLWALLQSLPGVQGYTISCLRAGGYIAEHVHDNPFVTAILTLQAGPGCYMQADGERQDFRPGEITIFDYRRHHLARNFSPQDWISLLILLPPAPL